MEFLLDPILYIWCLVLETPAWKPNLNVNTSVLNMESKAHWEGEKPIFMKLTFVKDNMKYVSANYNPTF